MTHILIPIKDIEEQIKIFRQAIASAVKTKDKELHFHLEKELANKLHVLELGKQISLDEKDIEEDAKKYSESLPDKSFEIWNGNEMVAFGYKQALLDLKDLL